MTWSTLAAPAERLSWRAGLAGPLAGRVGRCAGWWNSEYANGSSEHVTTTATVMRNRC